MLSTDRFEAFPLREFWKLQSPTFISFPFIIFVFSLVLVYYLLPKRVRWISLLAGSVLFYALAGASALTTVFLSVLFIWLAGILIGGIDRKDRRRRRLFLSIAVLVLLAVLVFYKYCAFYQWNIPYVVPLGISYYTFSAISYLADIYWGKDAAEQNFFKLALFLLFFPKILEGPISRRRTLGPQLNEGHAFDYRQFCFGMQLAVWGYFKKMVIADRAAIFTSAVFGNTDSFGGAMQLAAVILALIELYCDFSGCMDIAAGVAQMFGIELERNFNHPFFSRSASEYWRRWHITLGAWFRDYVYMPLAASPKLIKTAGVVGKRFGKRARQAFTTVVPLAVVWLLTGLWHGTGANYLVWGAYWGVLIILSAVFAPELKKLSALLRIDVDSEGWHIIQTVRTFLLLCISKILSASSTLAESGEILSAIFTAPRLWQLVDGTLYQQGLDWREFIWLLTMIAVLWFVDIQQEKGSVRDRISRWPAVMRSAFYAASVLFILVYGIYGPNYAESAFHYMQF